MKISITGHSRGIGKILFTKFIEDGHSVLGFSLSSGYDISNNLVREKIVELSDDCDLFINSAYNFSLYDDSQLHMLNDMYNKWNKKIDKHIINISSTAADLYPLKTEIPNMPFLSKYVETKHKQDQWFQSKRDYLNVTKRVKLTNIRPSRVYVEKFENQWEKGNVLDGVDIYNVIKFLIENPQTEIFSLTLKKHR